MPRSSLGHPSTILARAFPRPTPRWLQPVRTVATLCTQDCCQALQLRLRYVSLLIDTTPIEPTSPRSCKEVTGIL